MQFDGAVTAAARNDFLAAFAAKMSHHDSIGRIAGQRLTAARTKPRLDRIDGARPFDPQRGHRPATRRCELNDAKRG